MHRPRTPLTAVVAPLAVALLATACSESVDTTPTARAVTEPTPQLAVATAAVVTPPGRPLAANCFQCHGTDGKGPEMKIAGESAREIIGELTEMRAKTPGRNIMHVHALGYTTAQIALIGDYFSKVR